MKVSIVVSVYNGGRYLKPCVRSILRQSYEDFELVLIDDGSDDGSGAICDGFAVQDPRVRVVHQENIGYATARNAGLDILHGDAVTFVDSDDYLHRDHLLLLTQALNGVGGDLAMTAIRVVPEGWRGDLDTPHSSQPSLLTQRALMAGLFNNKKDGYRYAHLGNKLYRRELIDDLRFQPVTHEDLLFNTQVAVRMRHGAIIEAPTYHYQQHAGSVTHRPTFKNAHNQLSDYCCCLNAMPPDMVQYRAWMLRVIYSYIAYARTILYNPDDLHRFNQQARQVIAATQHELLHTSGLPVWERWSLKFKV